MSSRHEFIYSRWNKEFNPIKDQSDLIESGSIKTHKRTTDIYEWKTKLNQSVLENILAKHEIINEYIELLAIYNL
jgi:hypothetical protein